MEDDFSPVIQKKKKSSQKNNGSAKQKSPEKKMSEKKTQQQTDALEQLSAQSSTQNANIEIAFQPQDVGANGQPLPKSKHGMKPFAFFAGVFNILLAVGLVVGVIMLVPMFEGLISGGGSSGGEALGNAFLGLLLFPFFIAFLGIAGIGALVVLVAGILTIVSSFVSDKHNWNAWLVTAAVFDFLIMFFAIIAIFIASGSSNALIVCVAIAIISLLSAIFNIVDASRTKARLKEYRQKVSQAQSGKTFEVNVVVDEDSTTSSQNSEQNK